MTRAKTLLLIAFVLSFAAGAVFGLAIRFNRVGASEQAAPAAPPSKPSERSWLTEQLDLTPQQREQLSGIWSEISSQSGRSYYERRRTLQRERDDAVLSLLTSEQRTERDRLFGEYEQRTEEMERERDRLFKDAVERTKAVLTESQRTKYEQLLKEREQQRERHRRPTTGPATRPAEDAATIRGGRPAGYRGPKTRSTIQ